MEDKLTVARLLDRLGVPYIEAGNPGPNPKDMEFFPPRGGAEAEKFPAGGVWLHRRKGIRAEEDANVQALRNRGGRPLRQMLGSPCQDILQNYGGGNFAMIADTVAFFMGRASG